MENRILIITGLWLMSNIIFFLIFGLTGVIISTYSWMGIIWFNRKKNYE